ncbi:hypothetical protein SAMN04489727_1907 [Amycolatopsis tolypomycina]|uniref:Uncharacterized protein n=1 Tax=Amycolatopsis tolypomycina TaxID=208445 RepID=A0A1H4JI85_9PSEU|nr:hypothetical protein [Amycolatopsis tolypomycina]SEB45745.1 hypothetical protein SAMN04489727_1907 [Amycolatopsis tolypomycina]
MISSAPNPNPTPNARAGLGWWGAIGLVADVSAIVTLATQGPTALAVVTCAVALVAGIRLITTRLRGALRVGLLVLLIGAVALAVVLIGPDRVKSWASPAASDVTAMTGGCPPFQVFAQNRWLPYGARQLAGPNLQSRVIGPIAPNKTIYVDGWVHGPVAYPLNTPPWNSDVYFHLADNTGWVTFAGVRAVPTDEDPTGHSPDGGLPAVTLATCQGAIR